jgi:hypothetical protein
MAQFIVTRKNSDDSFDNVGMNNRYLTSSYKTLAGLIRYGVSEQWKIAGFRVQDMNDRVLYQSPENK